MRPVLYGWFYTQYCKDQIPLFLFTFSSRLQVNITILNPCWLNYKAEDPIINPFPWSSHGKTIHTNHNSCWMFTWFRISRLYRREKVLTSFPKLVKSIYVYIYRAPLTKTPFRLFAGLVLGFKGARPAGEDESAAQDQPCFGWRAPAKYIETGVSINGVDPGYYLI